MGKTALQEEKRQLSTGDTEESQSVEDLLRQETCSTKPPSQSEETVLQCEEEVKRSVCPVVGCADVRTRIPHSRVPVPVCRKATGHTVVVGTLVAALVILAVLAAKSVTTSSPSSAARCPVSCPDSACPDGWVGYRGKCYYFSEKEGNWSYSQSQCSALNASLAVVDSKQDLIFMLRFKVRTDPWIGLWREPGQGWKWANGLEFNSLFVIRGESDCAFLSEDTVSSSRCYTERNWICNQPDALQRGWTQAGT
ncbi:C-type lectin domain family 2 member L-like isoform X1 [Carettochelys insculpta]|uniref:C-type lectin domain family 2 member L-like isoform X1 n=1 Tax=Carettochelys insculpta TaxID=44489 RepID=UPI003EB6A2B3